LSIPERPFYQSNFPLAFWFPEGRLGGFSYAHSRKSGTDDRLADVLDNIIFHKREGAKLHNRIFCGVGLRHNVTNWLLENKRASPACTTASMVAGVSGGPAGSGRTSSKA
jgi:hypothetical protein